MLVTSRHFESYLKCPTKCWLQSRDEPPAGNPQSDSIQIMFTSCLLTRALFRW